ncbi:hypothetical protein AVEN_49211-1, partial [Araneus ventricosus]
CLLIDTAICKIPGYPLLKCQKVVADRFSEEVDVSFFRNLTLVEDLLLFDELSSDSDLEDIYIEPPDVAVVSEEDMYKEIKNKLGSR